MYLGGERRSYSERSRPAPSVEGDETAVERRRRILGNTTDRARIQVACASTGKLAPDKNNAGMEVATSAIVRNWLMVEDSRDC